MRPRTSETETDAARTRPVPSDVAGRTVFARVRCRGFRRDCFCFFFHLKCEKDGALKSEKNYVRFDGKFQTDMYNSAREISSGFGAARSDIPRSCSVRGFF